MPLGLILASTALVGRVWACPYTESAGGAAQTHALALDDAAATHCATSTQLVGANCSYSTGLMARRVVEEGRPWQGIDALDPAGDKLESSVSAPFTVGPEDGFRVIANELVQVLTDGGHLQDRLRLQGKWLEVDGVRYVVLTSYSVVNG